MYWGSPINSFVALPHFQIRDDEKNKRKTINIFSHPKLLLFSLITCY